MPVKYIPGAFGPFQKIADSRDNWGHSVPYAGYGMLRPSPNAPPMDTEEYVPGSDEGLEFEE